MKPSLLTILFAGFSVIIVTTILLLDLNIYQQAAVVTAMASLPVLFARPIWGVFILLTLRNIIDFFDSESIISFGSFNFDLASILAIMLVPWALVVIMLELKNRQAESLGSPPTGQAGLLRLPLVITWLAFLLLAACSLLYSSTPLSRGLVELVKLCDYFLLFAVCYLLAEKITVKKNLFAFVSTLIVPSAVAFSQIFIHTGFNTENVSNRLIGTFAHPNALAFALVAGLAAICMLLPLATSRRARFVWLAAGSFLGLLLLLTYTRSAWVGAFLIGFIWLLLSKRRWLLPAAVLSCLVLIGFPVLAREVNGAYGVNIHDFSLLQRLQAETDEDGGSWKWRQRIWSETFPAFYGHPVLGYGLGAFPGVRLGSLTYDTDIYSLEAHNDYLRILVELGALGLILYMLIFIGLIKHLLTLKNLSAEQRSIAIGYGALLLAVMVMSFSDNVIRNAPMQWMFWSLTGVVLGSLKPPNKLSRKIHKPMSPIQAIACRADILF